MIINLKIVRVNTDYCDYLRKFDNKVSYNKFEKELKPFIGILFQLPENIRKRCCNFKLLEEKCVEYNKS